MSRSPAGAVRSHLGVATRAKLAVLGLLEAVSDLRGNNTAGRMVLDRPAQPQAALWVYVSTIGELNAIDPLLHHLVASMPQLRPVLITDHAHYIDAYRARLPAGEVCFTLGHRHDAATLATHFPPQVLVVAEIPCLPSDAPCRFSMAFLAEAKRRGAVALLVNGWLYGQQPACRMDHVERRLLARDYVRAFDVICMQAEEGRAAMLAAGADASRLHVVGNIKFDAMRRDDWQVSQARSPALLAGLLDSGRPVIVAGCVTNLDEQKLVLEAFKQLRIAHPDALLVLAPRHPEVRERIEALRALLEHHALETAFRSALANGPLVASAACLVLDTMGDLRDFYAAATAAHVGVDHNVLEPLGFDKPVTVVAGWNPAYPSFPVYRLLRDSAALTEVGDAGQLCRAWAEALGGTSGAASATAADALSRLQGSVQRHLEAIAPCLPGVQR